MLSKRLHILVFVCFSCLCSRAQYFNNSYTLLFGNPLLKSNWQKPIRIPYLFKEASNSSISKEFLTGRYRYAKDTSFVQVAPRYAQKTVYIKKETYRAFLKMQEAARKEGVRLTIISGTRSYYDQSCKWDSKWNAPEFSTISDTRQKVVKLLRWWSMPGTSRHHWGTDLDLTSLKPAYFQTLEGKKMYNWMLKNAAQYGFHQPFNSDRSSGYQEEKWHWSYVPLAKVYLTEYVKQVTYADLLGSKGGFVAKDMDLIRNWVEGVNPECK